MNYYYFYFLEYEEFPQNKQSLPVYIFYCMCRRVFPQCVNVRNRVIRHTFTVKKPVPQGHNTTALSPTRVQYYRYCLARSPAAVSMSRGKSVSWMEVCEGWSGMEHSGRNKRETSRNKQETVCTCKHRLFLTVYCLHIHV